MSFYLERPKLRAAYERICDGGGVFTNHFQRVQHAEAFVRLIENQAAFHGVTFDAMAERLGY
jgi:hypothetical protein